MVPMFGGLQEIPSPPLSEKSELWGVKLGRITVDAIHDHPLPTYYRAPSAYPLKPSIVPTWLGSRSVQGKQSNRGAGTVRDQRFRRADGEEED